MLTVQSVLVFLEKKHSCNERGPSLTVSQTAPAIPSLPFSELRLPL